MTYLAGFIVVAVKVSSILIGCVRPAHANRRRCRPGRGGVGKIQGPTGVYAVLEWQGGGGGMSWIFLSPDDAGPGEVESGKFCFYYLKTDDSLKNFKNPQQLLS
jgi:hypothetical protein